MAGLFNLAADRALHMSQPPPPKISIGIEIGQPLMGMAGGGGLSSIQKRMNIGGQPHKLAYINADEASLLRQLGGSGRNVNGVPAYYMGDEPGSTGWGEASSPASETDPGETDVDEPGGYSALGKGQSPDVSMAAQQAAAAEDYARSQEFDPSAYSQGGLSSLTTDEDKDGLLGLGILTQENFQNFLTQLAFGALGMFVGGPPGAALGSQIGPWAFAKLKEMGVIPEDFFKDFKGDPEGYYESIAPDYIDKYPTEPVPEDKVEEKEKEEEEEEEEEEEGHWDKYYRERTERGPRDPYEGSEKTLEDIYGPDWREILERGVY